MTSDRNVTDWRLTRLRALTDNGELVLVTEDHAVQEMAMNAGDNLASFIYWKEEECMVTGWVTGTVPTEPFEFTVLAEEARE
jgi:hypothetical protein